MFVKLANWKFISKFLNKINNDKIKAKTYAKNSINGIQNISFCLVATRKTKEMNTALDSKFIDVIKWFFFTPWKNQKGKKLCNNSAK